MPILTRSEQIAHSTMRIECDYPGGGVGTGTGFIFRVRADSSETVILLITNKHVIEGSVRGRIRFTLSKGEYPNYDSHKAFTIDEFPNHWVAHPNPEVDLCALPLAPYIKVINAEGKNPFTSIVDISSFPTEEELADMGTMEPVVMVGYPNGIWDELHNLPILRRGVTATHPALDLNGKPEFMIDAACFPGSSGSPVFLFNEFGYETKSGGRVIGMTRIKFLGILYAGPQQQITGEIAVVKIPTTAKKIAVSHIPINLGFVIKARELLAFDEKFRDIVIKSKGAQQVIPVVPFSAVR